MDTPVPRKAALGFIFVTLVLMVLGFSIIIPVLPGLVTKFEGNDVAQGSHYYAWLLGIFGAVQFVASPILGSLSDRFGRRRVILIALAGTAVDYVVMGLAPSMGWLFAARIVSGATAGLLAACYAYIADVTPPERRAAGFGLVGAAFGLGFVLGPLIGGYLGDISLQLPFFAAAGIVALNWVYGAFVLPESLSLENRRPFSWSRANPVGSLLALRRFRGVVDLALMYFSYVFANSMLQSIWVLYTGYRYHWSHAQIGLSLAFVGTMTMIVQGGLVRRIIAVTGERRGLVLGLLTSALIMVALWERRPGLDDLRTLRPPGGLGGHRRPGRAGPDHQARAGQRAGRPSGFALGPDQPDHRLRTVPRGVELRKLHRARGEVPDPRDRLLRGTSVLMLIALALALRSFHLDDKVGAAASDPLGGSFGKTA